MRATEGTIGALLVGALAVICCAGPLLVAVISTTALAAWLAKSATMVASVAVIAAALGAVWLYRRRGHAQDCCEPGKKGSSHE